MNPTPSPETPLQSRRHFLKSSGGAVAVSALAGVTLPHVHAAGSDLVQLAIVGCGGRGTGALANALGTSNLGPMNLVAMADVFENKLNGSYNSISKKFESQVTVKDDDKHIGFDGYQHAMDRLKPGDVVILTTPLAFRWVHFKYAISKGLNVFMEKPLTADGPTSRRMLELAEEASKKNLKVGVGLMSRHSRAMQEVQQRIQDGEIGDLVLLRGYRMHGPVGSAFSEKWPGTPSELLWQISRFHSFLWASGGCYSDFYIHHIDQLCWMKDAWPVKAQGIGGRHYRDNKIDQNFDSYSVEYTFADGGKMYMDGRCINGCNSIYSSYAHGTKGMAIIAKANDAGVPSSTYKGQNAGQSQPDLAIDRHQQPLRQRVGRPDERDPQRQAVQRGAARRGRRASPPRSAAWPRTPARKSATTISSPPSTEYAPGIDKLTMDSPAFLKSDAEGKYPVPMPGICTKTEYPMQA